MRTNGQLRTGTAGEDQDTARVTERLYGLEVNAALAYGKALEAVEAGPIREELRHLGLEHQRHAIALLEAEVRRGHLAPEAVPDAEGPGAGARRATLTAQEVLEAMRDREEHTRSAYARSLGATLPGETREILQALEEDERRYLDSMDRTMGRRRAKAGAAP
jgi:hypothetical protein